jgi:hypothetical protein
MTKVPLRDGHTRLDHGAKTVAATLNGRISPVVLTLVAEVLSGETLITPGGAVDMATARGLEAFTWDGWLEELGVIDEAELPAGTTDAPIEASID